MPHLYPHEYIAVIASEDGLLMRPYTQIPQQPGSYVRVSWGKERKIETLLGNGADWTSSAIVYGIIGILDLFNVSYLLVITVRQDVGCLLDESQAIYGVKNVSAIPLLKDGARRVLDSIENRNPAHKTSFLESGLALEQPSESTRIRANDKQFMIPVPKAHSPSPTTSGVATPTSSESTSGIPISGALSNRLSSWARLPKRNATKPGSIPIGTSVTENMQVEPDVVVPTSLTATSSAEEQHAELEDRVIRGCIREYTKGCMFFAYHFDLTRSLQHKLEQSLTSSSRNQLLESLDALSPSIDLESRLDPLAEPFSTLPLWRRVDKQFWWNENLLRPFIDAGLDSYVLPVVQGHFQVAEFNLPANSYTSDDDTVSPVQYIIASRRSRNRAGLRYQRRGIDDEAHVANFVETETIVKIQRDSMSNVFSFVQIRGSVPLYWTQSGYSLKPPPVLAPERSPEQNLDAMKRHFQATLPIYGPHTIVNLAEQRGKESTLCNAYEAYVDQMGNKDVSYYAYDFHHETRGMKYERLTELIGQLERTFESQGYFWVSNGRLLSKQKGVFRVNCIDCLDRTNVVQSSFARHMLWMQLGAVVLGIPTPGWRPESDARPRLVVRALTNPERDIGGILHDGINSLARMYSATFSDWFFQAVIDFMLGCRRLSVFSEFLLKLQTTDPGELIRLSRIRADAIAISVSGVLEEGETLLSGWTAFSPESLNVKVGNRLEEKILLLTVHAFYIISFDYELEKVKLHTRVPLSMIVRITKGAYIISPLEEASRDPIQNAGFTVSWLNTTGKTSTQNTYSNASDPTRIPSANNSQQAVVTGKTHTPLGQRRSIPNFLSVLKPPKSPQTPPLPPRSPSNSSNVSFAAFKVLPVDCFRVQSESIVYGEPADDLVGATTCKEVVDLIVDAIKRVCEDNGFGRQANFVVEEDVVSLAEAQRATSMYAKVEYGVKRLLWLGG
ncbi:SacI homology domain-containing protein [Scleroderma yunnanense]